MEIKEQKVKVGDKLAFYYQGIGYRIETVSSITPTGRIKCETRTLNADLTVRGRGDSFSARRGERVTPTILDVMVRQKFTDFLRRFDFRTLTTETLRAIYKLAQSGEKP